MNTLEPLRNLNYEDLAAAVEAKPIALANLARTLALTNGDVHTARDLCRRAVALAPDDGKVRAICAEVLSWGGADWYFNNMRDHGRHQLYEQAFRQVIRPGARVLEIGAGTGLFSMLAARAGAREVIACERTPAVAEAARENIARNGLAGTVIIIEKDSLDLQVGVDMAGPADVLVWDNLSNNLIGAGALRTVDDAKRRLLKPGAALVPFAVDVRVSLAETKGFGGLGVVEGFDLGAFDALRPTVITRQAEMITRRSEAATMFCFDFTTADAFPPSDRLASVRAEGGRVNAIAQWLRFHLAEDVVYDTGEKDVFAFGIQMHAVEPYVGVPGAMTTIGGAHDRERTWFWVEGR